MGKKLTEEEKARRAAEREAKRRAKAAEEAKKLPRSDYRARLTKFMDARYKVCLKNGMTPQDAAVDAYAESMMWDLLTFVEDYSVRFGEEMPEIREQTRMYCVWIREVLQKKLPRSEWGLRMIFETYRVSARWYFDDYMSAMEFDRTKDARFWWPRRKVLEGKHRIATQIQEFIDDKDAVFLGISTPPGCGKSTLIKFLLSYIAGRWPDSANMYISYSVGMVKMMMDSVNGMLTDDAEYKAEKIFEHKGKPDVSNEYFTISFRRPGDFPTIGFVSLGGSVTGRTRANRFMVTDDLVKNAEEARSPERLESLWADYTATLTTRQIGDNVKQIMLGTRWSVHDPLGKMESLHSGDKRYRFIAIPVEDEDGHSNFNYEHPDGYSDAKIKMIRESLDPVDYSCLYLQKGIEKEGLAFPQESLTYYNGVLPEGDADRTCFVCDPAFGGGDSLAMPICKIYGDEAYIVDVIFDKRTKDITEPEVARRIMTYKCGDGRFEANNGGEFYADDVSKILKENGWRCNITSKKAPTTMSKEARIEQYSVDIKRMKFLQPSLQTKEYRAFMAEVMAFSYTTRNKHDDAPDSLAMLAQYLFEKRKKVSVPEWMIGMSSRPF